VTKKLVIAVAILAMAYVAPPAKAGEPAEGMFTVHGQIRDRYDSFNNYFDFMDTQDGDPSTNDHFAYWATRALVGIDGHITDSVWVAIDIQNIGQFGDRNPVGSAATFDVPIFQNFNGDFVPGGFSQNETELYRAVIGLNEIGGSGLSVTLGRNNKTVGGGLILGDEPFYNGNVFDGIDGTWKFDKWDISGFRFTTSEAGSLRGGFNSGNEDQTITGVQAHFGLPWDSHLEGYVVNLVDGRAGAGFDKADFATFGARWNRDAKEGGWMWDVQLAVQSGDFTRGGNTVDIGGSIFDLSGGYTFANHVDHTIFGGIISQSGDDDQTDDKVDSWIALVPTTHGRFGMADFFGAQFGSDGNGFFNNEASGITAFHVGYSIRGGENDRHKAWVQYWDFEPTEDSIDLGFATKEKVDNFGTEIDLGYQYKYDDAVKLFISLSQLMPDDGLTGGSGAPDDPVTRIYGGMTIGFTAAKKGM